MRESTFYCYMTMATFIFLCVKKILLKKLNINNCCYVDDNLDDIVFYFVLFCNFFKLYFNSSQDDD